MKIKKYINGDYEENCYLICDDNCALIVDPGNIINEMEEIISKNKLKVLGILVTHYHFDHVGALEYYKNKYNCEIYDYKIKNKIKVGDFEFSVIENFGHTTDSVSFYFEKENIMFTGDFLFKETIGNYKITNENAMYESLSNILQYNGCIKIYPGHGEESTLEHEFKYNPYLRGVK